MTTGDEYAPLIEEDPLQRAFQIAYRFLNRRDRTVQEMRDHLEQRGASFSEISDVIQTLTQQAYLDDARFARLFVQDKRELEQWGSERIRRGLLARGVSAELVGAALAGAPWPESPNGEEGDFSVEDRRGEPADPTADAGSHDWRVHELERALALLRRRFPSPPQDARERERALGTLLRKGYECQLALDAIAEHVRASQSVRIS